MTLGLVAILRGIRPQESKDIGHALFDAGVRDIEVPLNSPTPFDTISMLIKALPKARIGAGTVLSTAAVRQLADVGGKFVVSPDANPEVIEATLSAGMGSMPGVFTATEAFSAIRAGATDLKLFPASVMGPGGVSALRAVLPREINLWAVGGVDVSNLDVWRAAGCAGFGVGGAIYKPGDGPNKVGEAARAFVKAIG